MKNFCIIGIAVLCIAILFSSSEAQEEWGQASYIWGYGGDFGIMNPSFYDPNHFCVEILSDDYYGDYILAYHDYEWNYDFIELPGDSLNLEGYNNLAPFRSYDGTKLYFCSDRPGGYGGYDIWVSEWEINQWSVPVNLGATINSPENELGPTLPLEEDEIYFFIGYDNIDWENYHTSGTIYKSDKINNNWTEPRDLSIPINVNDHQIEPSISSDGSKLYFSSYYPGISNNQLAYVSYRIGQSWSTPIQLNSNINMLYWSWWDSLYHGDVLSISIDYSSKSLLFSYLSCPNGCIDYTCYNSQLLVGINEYKPVPENISLIAYPNPFNVNTIISFSLSQSSFADIKIYDLGGRLVETVYSGYLNDGLQRIDYKADKISSGIYFVRLETSDYCESIKLVLLK